MRLDVMKQRFLMFLRDFREYVTEWETRRKAREAFRADLERAAQKRRNRSDGAKRGWAKRKLDAQLAKVNAGATIGGAESAIREDAGAEVSGSFSSAHPSTHTPGQPWSATLTLPAERTCAHCGNPLGERGEYGGWQDLQGVMYWVHNWCLEEWIDRRTEAAWPAPVSPTQPATWDDHDLDCVASA